MLKLLVLAAWLVCLLLPALALANGCARHPEADVKVITGTDCLPDGGRGHLYYNWSSCVCAVCGADVYPDAANCYYQFVKLENHVYANNGYCMYCGYNPSINACLPENRYLFNDNVARQDRALLIGTRAIGGTAVVVESGNIRCYPSAKASIVGKVKAGQSYEILDCYMIFTGNGATWYQIKCGNQLVWVSASLVEVTPRTDDMPVDTVSTATIRYY